MTKETMPKTLIKKKCKACGHVVICQREKRGPTPSPKDCASCKSLGVEKAIEQRLMASRKGHKTEFKINTPRGIEL